MNILLVNHYAGSQHHGMEFRPYYLALEWIRMGHRVTIVGADQSHLRSRKVQISNPMEVESIDGITFIWLKTKPYVGNGVMRAANMASFVLGLFRFHRRVIAISQPHAIIASSTYPADMFPCHFIARKTHATLVFEIHDLWPLSPMEIGNMSKFHPFIVGMQIAEDFAYKHADKVVSILPNTLSHCLDHGLKKEKWCCVTNGYSQDQLSSREEIPGHISSRISQERGKGKFLIGYAGGHNPTNSLRLLIDALCLLDREKFHAFLVGGGSEKDSLIQYAQEKGAPMDFLDPIPKRQVLSFLEHCDVLYVGGKNHSLYRFGIAPNKLIDYMLSGVMIVQPVRSPNDLVQVAQCGFTLEKESPEMLRDAFITASGLSPEERKRMGRNGRKYTVNNLSYSKLARDFIDCIAPLPQASPRRHS